MSLGEKLYSQRLKKDRSKLSFYQRACEWKELVKKVEKGKAGQAELDLIVDRQRQI